MSVQYKNESERSDKRHGGSVTAGAIATYVAIVVIIGFFILIRPFAGGYESVSTMSQPKIVAPTAAPVPPNAAPATPAVVPGTQPSGARAPGLPAPPPELAPAPKAP
jgi:hypothetical protein